MTQDGCDGSCEEAPSQLKSAILRAGAGSLSDTAVADWQELYTPPYGQNPYKTDPLRAFQGGRVLWSFSSHPSIL